ncbi:EAL domain-containing protein [Azonexus sp. IMCC34839]|uniref:EAL domain-containing protein n=1 Tax=Azonexus sp. IMCC34839 TaxID=3133695 RepID=UPI00399B242C
MVEGANSGLLNWFGANFSHSSDPAWIVENGRLIECNEAARLTFKQPSRQALLATSLADLWAESQPDGRVSADKWREIVSDTQQHAFHRLEWLCRRGADEEFSTELYLFRLDAAGQRLLCCWHDLSASSEREVRFRELLEEQRFIFDNAHVGIAMLRNRRIIKCNARIAEMFGYSSPEELEGMQTLPLFQSEEQFEVIGRDAYAQLARQGWGTFEVEVRRRDGTSLWVMQTGRTLNPEDVLNSPSIWVYTDITQRKRALMDLQKSEEKFSTAFDSCPLAASISRISDGRFIEVNASYERNFGWSRADLVGKTSLEVGFWPDTEARDAWLQAIYDAGRLVDYEVVWKHKSGELRDVALSSEIIRLGEESCILTYLTDVTARKGAEADLRIAATAFESQEGMVVTDANGIILRVNRAFTESTGYSAEEVVGQTPRILRSGLHDDRFYKQMWDSIREQGGWQGEVWDKRKNGEIYPKWLTISAVKDETGKITHFVGTHFDITERKLAEERINALAFYDQLTDLPNRTLLQDRLTQALAQCARTSNYGALLFIDLDNFKTLNDTKGHEMGDLLLKEVAARLRQCIREVDTAARLGGDEFVVVLSNLGQIRKVAAATTEAIAEKILRAIAQPFKVGRLDHQCSASIGVALFHGRQTSTDELMRQADLAMYRAKAAGRNQVRFFDPVMELEVHAQADLERDLRRAIDDRQFVLHYQPQVLEDGHIIGAEALLRWHHPERGLVPPGEFIPVAEASGLILDIGMWVLKTACKQLAAWSKQPGLSALSIAVNVSAKQFRQRDFEDQVLSVLKKTGARPERLKLELTESMLAQEVDHLIERMERLRRAGVQFSLDDFGTGYSSLAYLSQLPIDQLKIDQSFVRDVLTNPNDAAIARTVVALGKSLGLSVIAEGVETEAQREFLMSSRCYAYQGYLFSKPLEVANFESFVLNDPVAA